MITLSPSPASNAEGARAEGGAGRRRGVREGEEGRRKMREGDGGRGRKGGTKEEDGGVRRAEGGHGGIERGRWRAREDGEGDGEGRLR